MAVIPIDFKNITDGSDDSVEISRRNVASRLYYYLYHTLVELVGKHNIQSYHNSGMHENLIKTLQNWDRSDPSFTKYLTISYKLSSSKEKRVKADYKLSDNFSAGDLVTIRNNVIQSNELIGDITKAEKSS